MRSVVFVAIFIWGFKVHAGWACSEIHSKFSLTQPFFKTLKEFGDVVVAPKTIAAIRLELYLHEPVTKALEGLTRSSDRAHLVYAEFVSSQPTADGKFLVRAQTTVWVEPRAHNKGSLLELHPKVIFTMDKKTGRIDSAAIVVGHGDATSTYTAFKGDHVFLDEGLSTSLNSQLFAAGAR